MLDAKLQGIELGRRPGQAGGGVGFQDGDIGRRALGKRLYKGLLVQGAIGIDDAPVAMPWVTL